MVVLHDHIGNERGWNIMRAHDEHIRRYKLRLVAKVNREIVYVRNLCGWMVFLSINLFQDIIA